MMGLLNVTEYIEEEDLHSLLLGKVKTVIEKNKSDVKVISLTLGFYEKVLARLETSDIVDYLIPTILAMRLSDPDIINRVVSKYIMLDTAPYYNNLLRRVLF